jgi:hypothetical protein
MQGPEPEKGRGAGVRGRSARTYLAIVNEAKGLRGSFFAGRLPRLSVRSPLARAVMPRSIMKAIV